MSKRSFKDTIKNPPIWLLILTYVTAVVSIAGSIVLSVLDIGGGFLQIVSYICYAIAAIYMAYSIYTFVVITPKVKASFKSLAERNEFTGQLIRNYGMRTIIFATVSFAISLAYGAYNITLSALERSVWYGMLAAYYILLASMRGGVIAHHRKKHKVQKRGAVVENEKVKQIKRYRNCGIMLIIMTFALLVAVLQMVLIHRTFTHTGMMIYVSAAYTVYKVTMSIINLVKAKKQTDMTVLAVRDINLADAMVSILALQTSMINSFGGSDDAEFASGMNAVTGAIVCLAVFALGIYMTAKANKELKKQKSETQSDGDANSASTADNINIEESDADLQASTKNNE